jgi:hypothetical protein
MVLHNIMFNLLQIATSVFGGVGACVVTRKIVHFFQGRRSDGVYGTTRFKKQLEEDKELDNALCLFFLRWILPPWLLILFACVIFCS